MHFSHDGALIKDDLNLLFFMIHWDTETTVADTI